MHCIHTLPDWKPLWRPPLNPASLCLTYYQLLREESLNVKQDFIYRFHFRSSYLRGLMLNVKWKFNSNHGQMYSFSSFKSQADTKIYIFITQSGTLCYFFNITNSKRNLVQDLGLGYITLS